MKEFIVITLVLGMASMACAGMTFEPASPTVLPGGTITVDIENAQNDCRSFEVGAVAITGPVDSVGLGTVNAPPFSDFPISGVLRDGSDANVWITGIAGAVPFLDPLVASGVNVYNAFTIEVSAGATPGQLITINDYSGLPYGGPPAQTTWNTIPEDIPSVTVQVVPEPATSALLALSTGISMLWKKRR